MASSRSFRDPSAQAKATIDRLIRFGLLAVLIVLGAGDEGGRHWVFADRQAAQSWVRYRGNPVLTPACTGWPACDPKKEAEWDSWDVEAPSVVKVGGIYHMFYEGDRRETRAGKTEFNINDQIGHATSSDGIHWSKDLRNPSFPGSRGTMKNRC